MSKQVQQPVWLVTGAAGTLGRELVRQILSSGFDCIALDRDARGLDGLHDDMVDASLGPPAIVPFDLAGAVPSDYDKLADTIESNFGHLDVLIHNAAHFKALRPLLHQPPDEWMQTLQTGLTGPFLLTACLAPLMQPPERSQVVFIEDRHPLDKTANWGAYGITQVARSQLAKTLQTETRLVVRTIDPGSFYSPLRIAAWPSDSPGDLPPVHDAAAAVMAELLRPQVRSTETGPL